MKKNITRRVFELPDGRRVVQTDHHVDTSLRSRGFLIMLAVVAFVVAAIACFWYASLAAQSAHRERAASPVAQARVAPQVPAGRKVYEGPRGGKYYLTEAGNKVYLPRETAEDK